MCVTLLLVYGLFQSQMQVEGRDIFHHREPGRSGGSLENRRIQQSAAGPDALGVDHVVDGGRPTGTSGGAVDKAHAADPDQQERCRFGVHWAQIKWVKTKETKIVKIKVRKTSGYYLLLASVCSKCTA